MNDENAFACLAAVRELSEYAMLRPAPRVLRCVPVQTFACKPAGQLLERLTRRAEILILLDKLSQKS